MQSGGRHMPSGMIFLMRGSVMENMGDSDFVQTGCIAATGGKIWYRMVGKNQPNPPLLVVHGGPGATYDYLEPLEALADKRPVIFYDQLDCGNSEKTDRRELWTVERYREELHQIRLALGLRKFYILGQSWGTVLAVEYALNQPSGSVAGLVLSGPMLNSSLWATDQKTYIAKFPPALRDTILQAEASGEFDSPSYQSAVMEYYRMHVCRLKRWPDCLNRSFGKVNIQLYQHMWGPSEFTVSGTLKDYDCVARLKDISVPVLFTCGQYDEAAPQTVRYFQRQISGAEIHVFDDASHEHHLEKTKEYLSVVGSFLDRTDRTSGD